MNILVVALNFSPELVGCGKFNSEFVNWFSNKANKIIVITTNPYYPEWKSNKNYYNKSYQDNICIVRCPIYIPKKINTFTRITHYLSFFISSLPPILYFGLSKIDVALNMCPTILSSPNVLLISFIKKTFFRKKIVTWIHFADLEIEAFTQTKYFNNKIIRKIILFFEKILLNNFDLISSISFYMNQKIKSNVKKNKKIYYLPIFIETKEFSLIPDNKALNPFYQKLSLKSENIVIMYSGTLNEKLSCECLVDTIKILSYRKDLTWIVSGDGPKKNYFVKNLKNFNNVLFYDFQPHSKLPYWLNIADIHLIPQKLSSVKYCLPSKLLGILASGKPVIGIAPEGSELGNVLDKYGIRVSHESSEEMSDSIIKLANNKELRTRLSKKSKHYISKYFEKDNILNNLFLEVQKMILK